MTAYKVESKWARGNICADGDGSFVWEDQDVGVLLLGTGTTWVPAATDEHLDDVLGTVAIELTGSGYARQTGNPTTTWATTFWRLDLDSVTFSTTQATGQVAGYIVYLDGINDAARRLIYSELYDPWSNLDGGGVQVSWSSGLLRR